MNDKFSISGGKIDNRNGHLINEDLLIVGKNYIVLADGSTGLGNKQLDDYLTSAEWYVKNLLLFLKQKLDNVNIIDSNELKNIVKDSICYIKKTIEEKQVEYNIEFEKYEVPSCSLLIVFETDKNIILFSLGDCITMIKKNNSNDIEIIRDDIINDLDCKVFSRMKEISKEKNISVKDSRNDETVNEMLKINRSKMNVEDGYYISSVDSNAVNYAKIREYDKSEIYKIFVCTDGFYFETLNLDYCDFMNIVTNDNVLNYMETVKNRLLSDEKWEEFSSRFKDLDDITAIVAYTNKK